LKKNAEYIKKRLEFWLLKYYCKERNELNGKELFTIFDLISQKQKNEIINLIKLRENELPVLYLKISEEKSIINTTERFIKLTNQGIEDIEYKDFKKHEGYDKFIIKKRFLRRNINTKTDGYLCFFCLKLKDGKIREWEIPTGTAGIGFWNVTKKCELIGRKYEIIK
jgi:hypothetical protein